jgi:hypothetical protein
MDTFGKLVCVASAVGVCMVAEKYAPPLGVAALATAGLINLVALLPNTPAMSPAEFGTFFS